MDNKKAANILLALCIVMFVLSWALLFGLFGLDYSMSISLLFVSFSVALLAFYLMVLMLHNKKIIAITSFLVAVGIVPLALGQWLLSIPFWLVGGLFIFYATIE